MPLVWGVHEWESNFSLKPKLPLPFLNLGGGSGEGVGIFTANFSWVEKVGGSLGGPSSALLTMPTLPAKSVGKVVGGVQSAGAGR